MVDTYTGAALKAMQNRTEPFCASQIKDDIINEFPDIHYSHVSGAITAGLKRGLIIYVGKGSPKRVKRHVKLYSWIGGRDSEQKAKIDYQGLVELADGVTGLADKLNEATRIIRDQTQLIENLKAHYLKVINDKNAVINRLHEALVSAKIEVDLDISEIVNLKGGKND